MKYLSVREGCQQLKSVDLPKRRRRRRRRRHTFDDAAEANIYSILGTPVMARGQIGRFQHHKTRV